MEQDVFPAHIRIDSDGKEHVQTVREHCHNTASYAEDCLREIGLCKTAYISGLLHDLGKYTKRFADYIQRASHGEKVVRGSVNHTFAGVRYVLGHFNTQTNLSELSRDLIAYAIGAHHGQFDCIDDNGLNGLEYRYSKQDIGYEEAKNNYLRYCEDPNTLQDTYSEACAEITAFVKQIRDLTLTYDKRQRRKILFYDLGLTARMIQSAVIEGDRRDTAEFMMGTKYPVRKTASERDEIWKRELHFAEQKISLFDNTSIVNKARNQISDMCRRRAEEKGPLFLLNVPTGSGKTLSSLRFALAHALKWHKERIIFVSPLLSILEQNASVIRDYLEDSYLILEHHSNAVQPENKDDELNLNELRLASWDAPVIITTLVQLLNTMFAGETQCIRRFHSLCNAVVIIDEVQSVPTNLLTMFNLTVAFLTKLCGASVVLCSATQPNWDGADYPLNVSSVDMVPYDPQIWNAFRRTKIQNCGGCRTEELTDRILNLAGSEKSVLIICNKKSESEFLYRQLKERGFEHCFHISAAMCIQHRRKVLQELRQAMQDTTSGPVFCVATQVIEAGVDISFSCVIRLLAGLDNAAQAAGRCNRNGEMEGLGQVYILNCTDENLKMLSEIRRDKEAASETLYEYEKAPGDFREDLSSGPAIQSYYQHLYANMNAGFQDDQIPGRHDSVFDLLSDNPLMQDSQKNVNRTHLMRQAFKTAGSSFHVFDESTVDVLVPFGEGRSLIADLNSERARHDLDFCSACLKKARNFTVTLYPYQKRKLENDGALGYIEDLSLIYLLDGYYDEKTGVTLEKGEMDYLNC